MSDDRSVIGLRFNQDQGCFTCCMESGLRLYNVEPLVELTNYPLYMLKIRPCSTTINLLHCFNVAGGAVDWFRYSPEQRRVIITDDWDILSIDTMGSLSQCEMLKMTNILACIAGGSRPQYSNNMVMLYDDYTSKLFLVLIFSSPVKSVRLRKDKIVVATVTQINVFSFPNKVERLFTLETRHNPRGLCEITPMLTGERHLLIFPGHIIGSIQIVDLANTEADTTSAPITVNAHQNELACIAINQQGTLVATASVKGTLIRVWDTIKRKLQVELRRGSDPATVYCINFSQNSEFLCCSSDKGTVHIFALKNTNLNKRSSFSRISIFGTYVESQWALATFTIPAECACICAFGSRNSVIAICVDGTFHKYVFNADGNCNREKYDVFTDISNDDDF